MYQKSNFVFVLHMKHEKNPQNIGYFSKIVEIFTTIYFQNGQSRVKVQVFIALGICNFDVYISTVFYYTPDTFLETFVTNLILDSCHHTYCVILFIFDRDFTSWS